MNFRQNFSQKKNISPFQKRLLPRLFITYPKAYAKETPFMDLLLNSHVFCIWWVGHRIFTKTLRGNVLREQAKKTRAPHAAAGQVWEMKQVMPFQTISSQNQLNFAKGPMMPPPCTTMDFGMKSNWLMVSCVQVKVIIPWNHQDGLQQTAIANRKISAFDSAAKVLSRILQAE